MWRRLQTGRETFKCLGSPAYHAHFDAGVWPGADVGGVAVNRVADTSSTGGVVSGLAPGNALVLQNNNGGDLVVVSV